LRGGSLATLMTLMGGVALEAEEKPKEAEANAAEKSTRSPVNCAVIGCGLQGREILNTLARQPNASVVAVCDKYGPFLKRAKEAAPKAETFEDHQKVLQSKTVQAVLVATPSHLHRDITLAALQAGKHVYCEAPLATPPEAHRANAPSRQPAHHA